VVFSGYANDGRAGSWRERGGGGRFWESKVRSGENEKKKLLFEW
jgi:hypothetical protein